MIHLAKKISLVFLIIFIGSAAELLNNIILGRSLSSEMFGRFKFIAVIITMLSAVMLFGQNMAIIRVFSKDAFFRFNWKKFIFSCFGFAVLVTAVASLVIGLYYRLLNFEIIFVFIAVIMAVGAGYYSALIRAREQYAYSIFLTKINSIGFLFALTLLIYFCKNPSLFYLLFIYTIFFILTYALAFYSSIRIPCGKEPVPAKTIKEGLWLFLISFSFTVVTQIDQLFITKMLGYEKLADYVAIITVTKGFDFVSMALWFVMMPHYAKNIIFSIKRDFRVVAIAGLAIVVVYLLVSQPLLHYFFGGKYDHSAYLLKFFIMIGFLKVLYSIPSGVIGGRLPERFLKFFLTICIGGVILNLAGNYFLIPIWGLNGAVIVTIVSWLFRVATAYYVVSKQGVLSKVELAENITLQE